MFDNFDLKEKPIENKEIESPNKNIDSIDFFD
jgi:hypothetical protein